MAAAEQQSVEFQQQCQVITECPICNQTFTDPRILPCIHTFCAKCLETNASKSNYTSGKLMPCPTCRKEFQIPEDGVNKMPKNFFMVKLLEMPNLRNMPQTSVACDACSEDNSGDVVPSAELFCRQCGMKLCDSCCKHHRKSKLTKNHELINMDESSEITEITSVQDVCDLHEAQRLKMYCSQCKEVACVDCFIENHPNHKMLDVNKADKEFRQQIQTGIENLRKQRNEIAGKKTKVYNIKASVDKIVSAQESMIYAKKNVLLQLMEKLCKSLISDLEQKRQEKLKEIKTEEEDLDFQVKIQESYMRYCHEMVTKGSPVDICRMQLELRSRAEELQRMSQSVCQRKAKPFEIDLRLNRFDDLQKYIEKSFAGSF